MTDHLDRVQRALDESLDETLAATKLSVLVMGPDLKSRSPAAKLRKHIIAAARKYGASVKPEHEALVKIAAAKLGRGLNLTVYEAHLVGISDVVVLVPDSPGSLCELGFFASHPEFSRKLLVLVNQDYPRSDTYVADGPLTAAQDNQGEVFYVNYSDVHASWQHVEGRILKVRASRQLDRLSQAKKTSGSI